MSIQITECEAVQIVESSILGDDFWSEITKELRSRGDIREYVFDLWSHHVTADMIMKLFALSEEELDAIIPKSRWFASKWVRCPKCEGKGGRSMVIPWGQK